MKASMPITYLAWLALGSLGACSPTIGNDAADPVDASAGPLDASADGEPSGGARIDAAADPIDAAAALATTMTMTIGASADSYIDQSVPAVNFGTAAAMKADGNGSGAKAKRSFVRFDVSAIPTGSAIISSTLTLCITALGGTPPNAPGHTHDLQAVGSAWVESGTGGAIGITWGSQPPVATTVTAAIVVPATLQCSTFDVRSDVQAWVDRASSNFGWRVRDRDETSGGSSVSYGARESAVPKDAPSLSVAYAP